MKKALLLSLSLTLISSLSFSANLISGQVEGFKIKNKDGWLDFGLVLPANQKEDFLNFQLSAFLSPLSDKIRVVGQSVELPSNLSIPSQKEKFIISIKIKKPNYRLPLTAPKSHIGVLQGRLPFKKTIEISRKGGDLSGLVNLFQFSSYSYFPIIEGKNQMNLKVGQNELKNSIEITDAASQNTKNHLSLGISLHELPNKEGFPTYLPLDLKLINSQNSTNVKSSSNTIPLVVSLPKEIFESNESEENSNRPVSFSLVWGEKAPHTKLPILSDIARVENNILFLDSDEINTSFEVLSYNVTYLKTTSTKSDVVHIDDFFGSLPNLLNLKNDLDYNRIQFNVYATDLKSQVQKNTPPALLVEDVFFHTKYMSRFEGDL